MSTSSETKQLTMKLLIDKKSDVVLFAEAGKDVVDFIFHLLALPIGTVIRLLTKTAMVGSLGNLYDSVETLNDTYMQPSLNNKDILLKPKTPSYGGGSSETLLLPAANSAASNAAVSTKTYYRCGYQYDSDCRDYVTHSTSAACPNCRNAMGTQMTLVGAGGSQAAAAGTVVQSSSDGYVKGVVTYMVMDNLEVKPMSTISSITLLNKFKVMDLNALEEKLVDFGYDEGVNLLKASMESNTVLTDVFLRGKKKTLR